MSALTRTLGLLALTAVALAPLPALADSENYDGNDRRVINYDPNSSHDIYERTNDSYQARGNYRGHDRGRRYGWYRHGKKHRQDYRSRFDNRYENRYYSNDRYDNHNRFGNGTYRAPQRDVDVRGCVTTRFATVCR
jgi:hypothetical protein